MKNTIVGILVVLLVVVGGWYVLSQDRTEETAENEEQQEVRGPGANTGSENTLQIPDSWSTYASIVDEDGWEFTIRHPSEVGVNRLQNGIHEFKFIGPDSEPNTEITDGFTMSVQIDGAATLDTFPIVGEVEQVSFNGYPALKFQTESELGNMVDHILFGLEEEGTPVIDVAYVISGDEDGSYEETINLMLSSMTFGR